MNYQDQVTLVSTAIDAYDTRSIAETHDIAAIVVSPLSGGIGTIFTNNEDEITADLSVFVDPTDPWVQANHYRLEEMFVVAPVFGEPQDMAWYKVTKAKISRDVLLTNQVDTVRLNLKKTSSIGYVS